LANYGRGAYIYTGYSFFKQLPAGVAGAFRLWANILAAPAARILERAEFLKQVSLFASLEEEQLQLVARIMSERWETDGGYLCHQGDEGDEMYILMQGEVKIIKESGQEQRVIYLAKRGEAIGELQVLSNNPRAATMQARGDVHLLVLEGSQFRSLMHHYPDITDRVIQMLVQRLATAGG
jgi:CRP-like cAMP-binding protein